ncbi:hypothetical protein DYH09_10310 [bacterium CPR1]|nr:hypothetical protein [bacterium CPR1]
MAATAGVESGPHGPRVVLLAAASVSPGVLSLQLVLAGLLMMVVLPWARRLAERMEPESIR